MGKATSLVRPRTVTADGEGLVSHAGLTWLGEVADRSGLTAGLCQAMAGLPRRRHDPGMTLAQMVVALADGAECVSDLAVLRDQPALFGPVASQPTAWRTIGGLGPGEYRRLAGARAAARAAAWAAGAGPGSDEAIIDVDATIVRCRSDKQDAAPTHKQTYGDFPLLAMIAETGGVSPACSGRARPGRTRPKTTSSCSPRRSPSYLTTGSRVTSLATTPPPWSTSSWPGPTRLARRTGSPRRAGTATSATASAAPSTTGSETACYSCKKRTGNQRSMDCGPAMVRSRPRIRGQPPAVRACSRSAAFASASLRLSRCSPVSSAAATSASSTPARARSPSRIASSAP
jgi:hypothetical protein